MTSNVLTLYNVSFSDLFESLDTQVETKSCPGVCMHTLTALICGNVLEDAECPKGMKCCMDEPLG